MYHVSLLQATSFRSGGKTGRLSSLMGRIAVLKSSEPQSRTSATLYVHTASLSNTVFDDFRAHTIFAGRTLLGALT